MRLQGGVVGAIDGEKDPRNLMFCFQLVVLLVARAPYPALPHAIPGPASRHTRPCLSEGPPALKFKYEMPNPGSDAGKGFAQDRDVRLKRAIRTSSVLESPWADVARLAKHPFACLVL